MTAAEQQLQSVDALLSPSSCLPTLAGAIAVKTTTEDCGRYETRAKFEIEMCYFEKRVIVSFDNDDPSLRRDLLVFMAFSASATRGDMEDLLRTIDDPTLDCGSNSRATPTMLSAPKYITVDLFPSVMCPSSTTTR